MLITKYVFFLRMCTIFCLREHNTHFFWMARRAVLAHRLIVTNATVKIQSMHRGLRTRRRTEVEKALQYCAKEFKAMLDETNTQLIDQLKLGHNSNQK